MRKQLYQAPATLIINVNMVNVICGSQVESTFTNEGYDNEEETFTW